MATVKAEKIDNGWRLDDRFYLLPNDSDGFVVIEAQHGQPIKALKNLKVSEIDAYIGRYIRHVAAFGIDGEATDDDYVDLGGEG